MERTREQEALMAIRLTILGSPDRARLTEDIKALVTFGLGETDVPTRSTGLISQKWPRSAEPDDRTA